MFYEDTQAASVKPAKVGKKVGNGFLSVSEAAKQLGISERAARLWCETGKLPAIHQPFGKKTRYFISQATIELFKLQALQKEEAKLPAKKKAALNQDHKVFFPAWKKAMAKGLIDGKAFSARTIADYCYYVEIYFSRFQQVSIESLKTGLAKIPTAQVATRQKYFKAIRCLAKFLIAEEALEPGFLEQAKHLSPKYHQPPKRLTVNARELGALEDACESIADKALLLLLAHTGVRASEACGLLLADLNLEEGFLTVRMGKGGKSRKIGISGKLAEVLCCYLVERGKATSAKYLFLNSEGKQLSRHSLYHRIERLGELAKVKVSPHSLRRAFVTINANAGRPLQMLQMACGHSDIKTTMGYCRTSEQEMITAMKEW